MFWLCLSTATTNVLTLSQGVFRVSGSASEEVHKKLRGSKVTQTGQGVFSARNCHVQYLRWGNWLGGSSCCCGTGWTLASGSEQWYFQIIFWGEFFHLSWHFPQSTNGSKAQWHRGSKDSAFTCAPLRSSVPSFHIPKQTPEVNATSCWLLLYPGLACLRQFKPLSQGLQLYPWNIQLLPTSKLRTNLSEVSVQTFIFVQVNSSQNEAIVMIICNNHIFP